jgi:hypothetical protein
LQLLEIQHCKRLVVRYGKSPWRYDENQDRPRHPFRVTQWLSQCGARDSQYGGPCPPRIAAVGGYKPFVSRFWATYRGAMRFMDGESSSLQLMGFCSWFVGRPGFSRWEVHKAEGRLTNE